MKRLINFILLATLIVMSSCEASFLSVPDSRFGGYFKIVKFADSTYVNNVLVCLSHSQTKYIIPGVRRGFDIANDTEGSFVTPICEDFLFEKYFGNDYTPFIPVGNGYFMTDWKCGIRPSYDVCALDIHWDELQTMDERWDIDSVHVISYEPIVECYISRVYAIDNYCGMNVRDYIPEKYAPDITTHLPEIIPCCGFVGGTISIDETVEDIDAIMHIYEDKVRELIKNKKMKKITY